MKLSNAHLYVLYVRRFYYSERKELSAVCVLEDFSQYGWRSARQLYNLPLQHILMAGKIKNERNLF